MLGWASIKNALNKAIAWCSLCRSHFSILPIRDRTLQLFILNEIALPIIPQPSQEQAITFYLDAFYVIVLLYFSHPRSRPAIAFPLCDRPTHYPTAKPGAGDRFTFPITEAIALLYSSHPRSRSTIAYPMCDRAAPRSLSARPPYRLFHSQARSMRSPYGLIQLR